MPKNVIGITALTAIISVSFASNSEKLPPSYSIWKYKNCETDEYRNFGFPIGDPTNNVIRKDGDCNCWSFQGEESIMEEAVTAYSEYDDCTACFESRALELCST